MRVMAFTSTIAIAAAVALVAIYMCKGAINRMQRWSDGESERRQANAQMDRIAVFFGTIFCLAALATCIWAACP